MWAVIIHECHVGYAFRTGLNNTDSQHGVSSFFSAKVPMKRRLKKGHFMSNGVFCNMFIGNVILICVEGDSGKICWMIYKLSNSAKFCVNLPQLIWQFMHNIL